VQAIAVDHRLRFLFDAAARLLAADEPRTFIATVYEQLADHLGLEVYFNFVVDEEAGRLRLDSSSGVDAATAADLEWLDYGQAVCGTVAASRQPMVCERIGQLDDPLVDLIRGLGIDVYACHPLIADGHLYGTLSFGSRRRDSFEAEEVELMRAVSDLAAVAIQRARLFDELRRQTAELEQAARRKDDFLAMLSHELRNPLAPLLLVPELLRRDAGEADRTSLHAEMIERQVRHMARLVDDLLDVSRIRRGQIALRRGPTSVQQIVEEAADSGRRAMAARRQRLAVDLPDETVTVDGDRVRLIQVILNLLHNASKFSPAESTIHLSVARDGDAVEVRVSDTGEGISAESLPHVFDAFMQADPSLDRSRGGLGLGLTLVRQLVELHGGSVTAASAGIGLGAVMTVRLPVAPAAAASGRFGEPDRAEPATVPLSILVVEDQQDTARALAELLAGDGHRVEIAGDGHQALEAAAVLEPDVVLLDIGLPGMDGYEVARRLRTEHPLLDPVLVAVTGYGGEMDLHSTNSYGFDHHLVKPVAVGRLRELLASVAPVAGGGNADEETLAAAE
jgi:signal transduction histidine kinase/ActR/RegA family two-component response regulator